MPNLLFGESYTDFGVNHALAVTAFEDGMAGHLDMAKELEKRYPDRIWNYAGVSPLEKDHPVQMADDPLADLDRQAEQIDARGLKLYPSHWDRDDVSPVPMDDPKIAYPLYEKALDLGIDVVSIHKSLPLGATPLSNQNPDDIGNAASNFPEIDFEIVHGGLTFAEEIGAMMAAQPNVYVNLETVTALAYSAPGRFTDIIAELLKHTGSAGVERLLWGTGAAPAHPRLCLESFWDLEFPEMEGYFETFTLTKDDKRAILGENFAQMHGVETENLAAEIGDDRFTRQDALMEPFSDFESKVVAE
jgi:predicted TIM-barrel fold metal-dependent hydrolase